MSGFDVVFTCTPESFASHQRKLKQEERKARELAEAAKVAKARAARYNLTLRAKDIKKARDDGAAAGAAAADAAAAGADAAPSQRRSLVKSLTKRMSRVSVGSLTRRRASTKASAKAEAQAQAEAEAEVKEEEEQERPSEKQEEEEQGEDEDEDEDDEVILWMGELARALEAAEAYQINVAILTAFLSEMAPDRVEEVDQLLDEYDGREEELFDELARQYPLPEGRKQRLNEETYKALGAAIPDEAQDDDDEDHEEGYILSLMGDNYGKWAANVQGHILKQRMMQAGATQQDVDAIMNNRSEMI